LCQLIHATRLAAKRSNEAATQAVLLYRFFKSERIKVSDNVRFRWQCGQERGERAAIVSSSRFVCFVSSSSCREKDGAGDAWAYNPTKLHAGPAL